MKFTKAAICTNGGRVGNADNMWCWGSSTILRVGGDVFFTHTRLIEERTSWNCNSFELYASRSGGAWQREYTDEGVFQRSPCPILYLGGSLIGVTVNPGDCSEGTDAFGPAGVPAYITSTPMLYVFDISGPAKLVRRLTLRWDDPAYWFIQHSYRSHTVDTVTGELFLPTSTTTVCPRPSVTPCWTEICVICAAVILTCRGAFCTTPCVCKTANFMPSASVVWRNR